MEMNQSDNAATESDLFLLTKTLSAALRGDSELQLLGVNYRVTLIHTVTIKAMIKGYLLTTQC